VSSASQAPGLRHGQRVEQAWDAQWIVPQWPAPPGVRALITTRAGGFSSGSFGAIDGAGGMNLSLGSPATPGVATDDALAVARNRERLRAGLPRMPCWLHQVHGASVMDAGGDSAGDPCAAPPQADAAYAIRPEVVCAVLVADCLPVLLADVQGRGVAAAHAGWRGLAAGVLQNTVAALRRGLGDHHARILAYLGPTIGPAHFVVGPEVLSQMLGQLPQARAAFASAGPAQYRADLCALARQALAQVQVQVQDVYGGGLCTYSDPVRFYSFRRDRITGRHAALIWRQE
jgi:polyphenol oxidase